VIFRIDLLDRRAMLAMTPPPSLRAQRSNPVNQTTGAAGVAIQPPLMNYPAPRARGIKKLGQFLGWISTAHPPGERWMRCA